MCFAPFTCETENGDLSLRVLVSAETDRPFSEPHATNSVDRLYSFCTHPAEIIARDYRSGVLGKENAKEIWSKIFKSLPCGDSRFDRPSLTDVLSAGNYLRANQLEGLLVTKLVGTPTEATCKSGSYGPRLSSHEAVTDTQDKSDTRPSGPEDSDSAPGCMWTFVVHSTDPTEFNASAETITAPQEAYEQDILSEQQGTGCDYVSEDEDEREMAIEHIRLTSEHVQNAHAT